MINLAPIMISTYTRLTHLKETILHLKKNILAKDSDLYIYSDAPQVGHEKDVLILRDYLKTINGFKSITIIERSINGRVANSRGGMRELLERFNKVIYLEDDIITAPGFLTFMNQALESYKDNKNILSVCGYTPNLSVENIQNDIICLPRCITWGLGIWLDKFNEIKDISQSDYQNILNNTFELKRLEKNHGIDLLNRFKAEAYGHLDGLDTKACFLQFKEPRWSVHPKNSLVNHNGNDGSGVHSSITNKFKVTFWDKIHNFNFPTLPILKDDITAQSIQLLKSDTHDISSHVIESIYKKVIESGDKVHSIWGTDIITTLFLKYINEQKSDISIRYIMDSWPENEETFNNIPVITPQAAFELGEKNFIILSFASRFKMKDIAKKISPEINIIIFTDD